MGKLRLSLSARLGSEQLGTSYCSHLCEHGGMTAESQEWRHSVATGLRVGYSAVVPQSRQC